MSLFFIWVSFSHSSCTPHASYPYSYILFFPSFLLIVLSIRDKKGKSIPEKYTSLYHYFYMTHVHTFRGSYSTSCTFVGGESHRGDAYTKGEKTFFLWENLVLLYACFLVALWCFELCLVSSMLCCSHRIMLMCRTCIYLYAIMLYWFHVRMIICFTIWSL